MKFLTHLNDTYLYTANWYDYITNNGEVSHQSEPSGSIRFNGGVGPGGNTLSISTNTLLRSIVRVDTLKDVNGNLLIPTAPNPLTGAIYEVRGVAPIMNVWGSAEGYQMVLTRVD